MYNVHPTWQRAYIKDDWKLVWSPAREAKHIWNNFTSKGKLFSRPWSEWNALAMSDPKVAAKVEHIIHPKEYELYRVDTDFYEAENLALDPENQQRIEDMTTALKDFMKELGDPLYDPVAVQKPKVKKNKKKK